ncbi:hypothetical protein GCM10017688_29660 [Streptomyces ramulosus]
MQGITERAETRMQFNCLRAQHDVARGTKILGPFLQHLGQPPVRACLSEVTAAGPETACGINRSGHRGEVGRGDIYGPPTGKLPEAQGAKAEDAFSRDRKLGGGEDRIHICSTHERAERNGVLGANEDARFLGPTSLRPTAVGASRSELGGR